MSWAAGALTNCLSAAQLGRPCSLATAACASCRLGNSPAARRRFASSLRYRRLGRPGSERDPPVMAVLPSRPGSACIGQERLAVPKFPTTGELAALPADPGAAGTTNPDDTRGGARSVYVTGSV